jgi:hypothetical protein
MPKPDSRDVRNADFGAFPTDDLYSILQQVGQELANRALRGEHLLGVTNDLLGEMGAASDRQTGVLRRRIREFLYRPSVGSG